MLDASLLSDYCERFFGFGRWNAPVWLIGIEEAGGHDEAEIKLRLDTWAARSRRSSLRARRSSSTMRAFIWPGNSGG